MAQRPRRLPRGVSVTLGELGIAYRKAKVDLFYSTRMCMRELDEYESDLVDNLRLLQRQLASAHAPEIGEQAWTLAPKKILRPELTTEDARSLLANSDPLASWAEALELGEGPEAQFRVMEALSVEFHVFATLWIMRVGQQFERMLGSSACASRLRRQGDGSLNALSLGSMMPYLPEYTRWRDDGMRAIRGALDDGQDVVAIAADAQTFFHSLDPAFMVEPAFLEALGVNLSPADQRLHRLFIGALREWMAASPLEQGLPVGLSASALIANVALSELDRVIEHELAPIYYGRYVDDILLVLRDVDGFRSSVEVWNWIIDRAEGLLRWSGRAEEEVVEFVPEYLAGSDVRFANEKNKMFALSGESGRAMLASIEAEIRVRSSEWRALPELPSDGTSIESALVKAVRADGEPADGLHRFEQVSVRRASFALNLRDVEAYSRALAPDQWSGRRRRFLQAYIRHVAVLPEFFDFYGYLPRVLSIACSCGDFDLLARLLERIEDLSMSLGSCRLSIAGGQSDELGPLDIWNRFHANLVDRVVQSIESSIPLQFDEELRRGWEQAFPEATEMLPESRFRVLQRSHRAWFRRDLSVVPFRFSLRGMHPPRYARGLSYSRRAASLSADLARELLPDAVVAGVVALEAEVASESDGAPLVGNLFPTRPLGLQELCALHPEPFSESGASWVRVCLLALRGYPPEAWPSVRRDDRSHVVEVALQNRSLGPRRIAVASWKTEQASWVAAATRQQDPDATRLARLYALVETVRRSRHRPHYLVFPECSIPVDWFLALAAKLHGYRISLIAGVEYLHSRRRVVRSQIWAALSNDCPSLSSYVLYRQDKQVPAQHEEADLRRIANRVLRPEVPWSSPPVIDHAGFHFGMLMCSELTNIRYRADLGGRVDALIIPEWNQDTETFNALVESGALDVHAYIVQANDRQYGDSRIRAPARNSWERDVVRVKGGLDDYFVTGEIDIAALRAFQSNHRSPPRGFKPVPDGFEISRRRRVLPRL